jgi:hypothetical protein
VTGDVVDVLDRESEPNERPMPRARHLDVGIAAKRSEPIVGDDLVH